MHSRYQRGWVVPAKVLLEVDFIDPCAGGLTRFLPAIGIHFWRAICQCEAIGATLALSLTMTTEGSVVAFKRTVIAVGTRGIFGT